MENKKVFLSVIPYYGHVYPILGVAQELVKREAEVIFYGLEEMREIIENTGSTFRELPYNRKINAKDFLNQPDPLLYGARIGIEDALKLLPDYTRDVDTENFDLIIYDQYNFSVKYLLNHLNYKFKNGLSNKPPPPALIFSPSFAFSENIYPITKTECDYYMYKFDDEFKKKFEPVDEEQAVINEKYGMDVQSVYEAMHSCKEKMVLVSVLKELHPYTESYNESYHFVGPCFLQGRNETIKNPKLQSFLDLFDPINPRKHADEVHNKMGLKLVYVSLGTVHNENVTAFEILIEAIKNFDLEEPDKKSDVKLMDLRVVISAGDVSARQLNLKLENKELSVPNNILILPSAPQLEILKRASIYITHCGMNSTNEGLHYGVPLICVPVNVDQPLVAMRLSDQLNLAKKFDVMNLSTNEIRAEIHEILRNKNRVEKVLDFAKISNSQNGAVNSVNLIEKYLSDNN